MKEWIRQNGQWVLGAAILIFKLALVPWVEITDADAVSRIIYAYDLAAGWHFISDTIWPPAHFYFLAIGAEISDNPQVLPVIMHVLVSWLGFFTMYAWLKQQHSEKKALWTSVIFSLSPLVLRLGNSPMAESFLIALLPAVLYYLGKIESKTRDALKAGLLMTALCAFRYEAWLLALLLGGWLLLEKRYRDFVFFGIVSALFPIFWMLVQWRSTGDFLYGIHGNDVWTHQYMGMTFETDIETIARRLLFFPFSLWIAIGPVALYLWINVKPRLTSTERNMAVIAGIYLLIEMYQCVMGNLMSHHRLTIALVIFSMPFLAHITWNSRKLLSSILLTLGLSLLYPMEGIGPIPRMKYREVVSMNEQIQRATHAGDKVLIDFIGWDNTYYSLLAQFKSNSIILSESMSDIDKLELINTLISGHKTFFITRRNSPLIQGLNSKNLLIEEWVGEKYVVIEIEKK